MKKIAVISTLSGILLCGCTSVPTPQIPPVTYEKNQSIEKTYSYEQKYIKDQSQKKQDLGAAKFIKRRIAVARFGDAAMAENSPFLPLPEVEIKDKEVLLVKKYNVPQEPYKTFTADLISALYKTNKFIIVERQDINNILNEQKFTKSGHVRKESAAKLDDLLGAELLITGVVTEEKGKVSTNIRVYDIRTGRIMAVSAVTGANEPDAIEKAVHKISELIEQLPWTARVTKVEEDRVYINTGQEQGIQEGDKFEVVSLGEEIIDPNEGTLLGSEESPAGLIIIKEVKKKYSIAKIVNQSLPFKRGDIVRTPENVVIPYSKE